METSRAWAEVDLDALTANLERLRRRIDSSVALLLVAKADAYGHGAVAVAHHALGTFAEAIGVTNCAEAMELRQAGIRARLVVLGPTFVEEAPPAIRSGVELCVPSIELGQHLGRLAEQLGKPARVHVKVDSGMGRLGVPPERALSLLETVQRSPFLELAGVMTHLAATEGAENAQAHEQMATFERILRAARGRGLLAGREVWIHAANSAGVLSGLNPRYDAVRVGIAAYGIAPDPRLATEDLHPVLSVRTRIVHLRDLRAGQSVGYGGTWVAPRPTRLAILPVGYDDGVAWRLSGRGSVLIRGKRSPIVGRVSMDYTTVDVTNLPALSLGETATLVGADGAERIRVEEIAKLAGTIPYEILCQIGKRVKRTYVGGPVRTPRSPARETVPG